MHRHRVNNIIKAINQQWEPVITFWGYRGSLAQRVKVHGRCGIQCCLHRCGTRQIKVTPLARKSQMSEDICPQRSPGAVCCPQLLALPVTSTK